MPIYAYKCESCGHSKDVLQKMSAPLLVDCPACGSATFKKQLTAAGFQLKGSGWYATDFKGGSTSAPALAGSATDTSSSADSKTDTKVESASDAKPSASSAAPAAASGGCGGSCACH